MTDHGGKLMLVTGLSGAGLSSALKILEDLGYEAFDNFPLSLIDNLMSQSGERPVAVGLDARTRGFDTGKVMQAAERYGARIMFMTCDEGALQQRFAETRRRHPLAADRPVSAGIKKEMALLYPLRDVADPLVDTTDFSIHDLRRYLNGHFGRIRGQQMTVGILTFGFKNGLPREADIVMDVRFLKNPHWDMELRPLTGLDKPVMRYINEDPALEEFLTNFKNLLLPLLPRFTAEGKSYLTIAIGCTGGRHRSVYVSGLIGAWLAEQGIISTIDHRDLNRN